MEEEQVQAEEDARLGQEHPGTIRDATHVERVEKRLYRKNGQFADFWLDTDKTWRGSAFTAQDLDDKKEFTLI